MDWQRCYADRTTPWDLRQPTPPLIALIESGRLPRFGLAEAGAVAVPGCGRGHDLRVWAGAGYRATGFDVVPEVVEEARALLAWNQTVGAQVLCRDILGLADEFSAAFDAIYDYTCFCALPPHLRGAYGQEMTAITAVGGLWLGLAFPLDPGRAGIDGPPYLIRPGDLIDALAPGFELIEDFAAERSVPQRRAAERWFVFRRQG